MNFTRRNFIFATLAITACGGQIDFSHNDLFLEFTSSSFDAGSLNGSLSGSLSGSFDAGIISGSTPGSCLSIWSNR